VSLAIAGHQWLVRNAEQFLATCGEYDIIIVDEAHRARFRNVDVEQSREPNQYLWLLRQLSRQTKELLLLTATPMQLNEVELWALLELLEPEGWNTAEYRRFYQEEPPDLAEWKYRRDLWRKTNPPDTSDFLLASDNDDYIYSQLEDPAALQATLDTMQHGAPAKRLMSRHTRELLRQYRRQGLLDAPVPQRQAQDVVITMTDSERALYDEIKELVRQCYAGHGITPQSLGFITTIFRKRFGSSTYAYAQTLRNAANRIPQDADDWMTLLDDADLDELTDGETNTLNNAANLDALLKAAAEAERLSHQDSKRNRLAGVITELREQGHAHILLFTQFRDTQSWLSEHLQRAGHYVTELYGQDGHLGDRGRRLEEFRQQPNGLLLCTETASESLNLQFCSAVVNYDIPWNPMTLEQRAGRIDRIGQERPTVDVVNLFYENTAEHDAYEAVARRFEDIRANVGEYPPIIAAGIQRIIRDEANPDTELERLTARNEFDINRLNADWDIPNAPLKAKVSIDDLERPLREPELMPANWSVKEAGGKHWDVIDPSGHVSRVTTDPESYQQADGRLQWWCGPR
jgi:SNF2 family DNA or RNA helicase